VRNLHDVHAVIDEMTELRLLADIGLVFPLQTEMHMPWWQNGAHEEIDGLQPAKGALLHAGACLEDDQHPTITG
jgi:hypothetical protein